MTTNNYNSFGRRFTILLSYFLLCAVSILPQKGAAQEIVNSVSHVLSSKAAKGSLYDYNDEGEHIALSYIVKQSKKGNQTEIYKFDKQTLEFVGSEEKLVAATTSNPETKGDQLLVVYPNLRGIPKLKLGYMLYTEYPRYTLSKFITTSETTPKGAEGDRMMYVHHRTEEADNNQIRMEGKNHKVNVGDVQLIGCINEQPLYTSYASRVYDAKDVTTKYKNDFTLEYSYVPIASQNLDNGDIAIVLRSYTIKDFPKPKVSQKLMAKFKLAETTHLKVLRINTIGEIIVNENIEIDQPESGYYYGATILTSEDNKDLYVVGTMKSLKILGPPLGRTTFFPKNDNVYQHKAEKLFVAHIKNGVLKSSQTTAVSEILKNTVLADGSAQPKDAKSYMGKIGNNGLLPVSAIKSGENSLLFFKKKGLEGYHILQLGADGKIAANYIFDAPKGKSINIDQEAYLNSDGEINVFSYFQPKVKKDASGEDISRAQRQRYCVVSQIDPANKSLSPSVNITPNANLDLYDPFFFESKDQLVTLGNGRKKEIVLSRLSIK